MDYRTALINLLCYAINEPNEAHQIADLIGATGTDRQTTIRLHYEMMDELEPTITTMPLEEMKEVERKYAAKIIDTIIAQPDELEELRKENRKLREALSRATEAEFY